MVGDISQVGLATSLPVVDEYTSTGSVEMLSVIRRTEPDTASNCMAVVTVTCCEGVTSPGQSPQVVACERSSDTFGANMRDSISGQPPRPLRPGTGR